MANMLLSSRVLIRETNMTTLTRSLIRLSTLHTNTRHLNMHSLNSVTRTLCSATYKHVHSPAPHTYTPHLKHVSTQTRSHSLQTRSHINPSSPARSLCTQAFQRTCLCTQHPHTCTLRLPLTCRRSVHVTASLQQSRGTTRGKIKAKGKRRVTSSSRDTASRSTGEVGEEAVGRDASQGAYSVTSDGISSGGNTPTDSGTHTPVERVENKTYNQLHNSRIKHEPVMYEEVMRKLCQEHYNTYVDATFGAGGHSRGMLSAMAPGSKLYAIDRDWTHSAQEVADLRLGYGPRFNTINGRFGNMRRLLHDRGVRDDTVGAILFDVGVSSMQLDVAERGFSHARNGPLDMRMDPNDEVTAADLVNNLSEEELKTIIRKLGEDPKAAQIAHAIVLARMKEPITETVQLADIVFKATGSSFGYGPHPATQTFQALRILLNKEIEELHNGLVDAVHMLEWGGTLAVLTFHSLEARIAKSFLKKLSEHTTLADGTVLPPLLHRVKTEWPSEMEKTRNRRASSAMLRSSMRNKHPIHPEHFTFLANTPRVE